MDIFKKFATDEKKENEGVWVEIGDDVELLIARSGNKKYSRLLSAKLEKNQRKLDLKDEAADKLSTQIIIDVLAESVLLGWKGPFEFKGEPMTYSVANAKTALAVPDFRGYVARLADDIERYRVAQEDALGKN